MARYIFQTYIFDRLSNFSNHPYNVLRRHVES